MKITEKDWEQLVLTSRLDLAAEDKAAQMKVLNEIVDFVDMLHDADTDSAEPAVHVAGLKNVFREDRPQAGLDREQALANAPEEEAGAFKVPRIV